MSPITHGFVRRWFELVLVHEAFNLEPTPEGAAELVALWAEFSNDIFDKTAPCLREATDPAREAGERPGWYHRIVAGHLVMEQYRVAMARLLNHLFVGAVHGNDPKPAQEPEVCCGAGHGDRHHSGGEGI